MVGRPSPRKDRDTQKAEQVSWLAAWLTLCAFPSFDTLRTVARADFNAAHSCGAAMDSPSLTPARFSEGPPVSLGGPVPGTTQPRLVSCPGWSSRTRMKVITGIGVAQFLLESPEEVKTFPNRSGICVRRRIGLKVGRWAGRWRRGHEKDRGHPAH